MNYPTILIQDVAGEAVQASAKVTRFQPGDRVVGHVVGMATKRIQDNAFQAYTILQTNMIGELPSEVSHEDAAVLPLGLSTASPGLFQDEFLHLQLPTEPHPPATGEVLLVWGGAGSVGSNAIQLGVAAGYEVITTASPKNFAHVRNLGASHVVEELVNALDGKTLAGAMDRIGFATSPLTVEVVTKSRGSKFVSTVKNGFQAPEEVTVKNVFGTTINDKQVDKAIY